MTNLKSYKTIIQQFGKENIFEFKNEDNIYLIVGYPHWRAFIITPKIDFRLEVYPSINARKRKFEFLEEATKTNGKSEVQFKIDDPFLMNSYLDLEAKFFSLIPENFMNLVKVFKDSHWEIIQAIIFYGHNFLTLIDSNPVLAYLLVNLDKINPSFSMYVDKGYIEMLITEKQKEILGLANFPSTQRIVKLISKFDIKIVDVELLKYCRLLFITKPKQEVLPFYHQAPFHTRPDPQEEMLKILSYAPNLNKNLLKTLALYPSVAKVLTSQALQELSVSDSFKEILKKLKIISANAYKWNIPLNLDNLDNLDKLEKNLKAAIKRKKDQINYLPPPPIPDGQGIYAIRTVAELRSWAKKQHNCIWDYDLKIKRRQCHLYKIEFNKEEATLEILINGDGLSLGELKSFRNSEASKELKEHISEWFHINKNSQLVLKRITHKSGFKQL